MRLLGPAFVMFFQLASISGLALDSGEPVFSSQLSEVPADLLVEMVDDNLSQLVRDQRLSSPDEAFRCRLLPEKSGERFRQVEEVDLRFYTSSPPLDLVPKEYSEVRGGFLLLTTYANDEPIDVLYIPLEDINPYSDREEKKATGKNIAIGWTLDASGGSGHYYQSSFHRKKFFVLRWFKPYNLLWSYSHLRGKMVAECAPYQPKYL